MKTQMIEPKKCILIDLDFGYLTKEAADNNDPDFYLDKKNNVWIPIIKNTTETDQ